jgi:hypothetical protein
VLTPDQLDALTEEIVDLYERYQVSVLRDIARRLAGLDYATETAAWQVQRLTESGKVYEEILSRLAQTTGQSEQTLRSMFEKAGVRALKFDDAIYRDAGLQPLPLNLSPAMAQVLAAGLAKTGGLVRNLTMTTALSGQEAFIQAADLAYMQITGGAMDYQSALKAGIRQVAGEGLTAIHFSGRREQLDVALRRAVLTGVNQTAGQLKMTRADEMGADLVQTSAHAGARNTGTGPANHESWQGKIFSRSGRPGKYPDFVSTTGYGTGAGLGGWGCRHSFYPFFEGISARHYDALKLDELSSRRVTYNGEEMSVYDATQKQRQIERQIRKAKRQAAAVEAAGLDNSAELARVRIYQAKMRDFIKQTGLQRQRFREQIFERV